MWGFLMVGLGIGMLIGALAMMGFLFALAMRHEDEKDD